MEIFKWLIHATESYLTGGSRILAENKITKLQAIKIRI